MSHPLRKVALEGRTTSFGIPSHPLAKTTCPSDTHGTLWQILQTQTLQSFLISLNQWLDEKVVNNLLNVKGILIVGIPGTTGWNKSKKTVGGGGGLTYLLAIIPTVSPANHLTSCVVKSRETTFRRDHLDPAKHKANNLGGAAFCLGISNHGRCHLNVMSPSGWPLGMKFHLWSKYSWCWSQNQMFKQLRRSIKKCLLLRKVCGVYFGWQEKETKKSHVNSKCNPCLILHVIIVTYKEKSAKSELCRIFT